MRKQVHPYRAHIVTKLCLQSQKKLFEKGKWSERQDLNLSKCPDSQGIVTANTQRDAHKPIPIGPDLSAVVTAWSKLPAAFKAAILAIINSAEDIR